MERNKMVVSQIEARGVKDARVLSAMRSVPRHMFVPHNQLLHAYEDGPVTIGYGQTISQPYVVASMTEALQLQPQDKVLEVGTGSGYQAAILSRIVFRVYTIEIVEALAKKATETFDMLEYDNIIVRTGDGYHGWMEEAPFDAIIVTAAPEEVPEPLIDQLAEGGRMVIPVGARSSSQDLLLLTKKNGTIYTKKLFGVLFVPFTREGEEN